MKTLLFLFAIRLLIFLPFYTSAQSLLLVKPGDTFSNRTPQEWVVMDKYTFGNFHYTAARYDTLSRQVTQLDSLLSQKDSSEHSLMRSYEQLSQTALAKDRAYEQTLKGLNTTLSQSLIEQNRLQVNYVKLEQKHKRVKRWRNSFMGVTGVLAGIIVLSIIK